MIGKRKDIGKITGLICEVTLMKDFSWKIFAIKTIIFSIWGLSTLPFLSIIVQYIDSITGFSSGNGYLTNNMDYLLKVLLFILVAFCF